MRALKLQMQITVDGYVGTHDGKNDWINFDADPKILDLVNHLVDSSDAMLMGRRMSAEFMKYWESVKEDSPEYSFAQKMVNTPKIIFSKTIKTISGKNVRVENGDLKTVVNQLKSQPGKDIIVYGGANFVSSLIKEDLIDDYYFSINPVALGNGLSVFGGRKKLKLIESTRYGTEVVNHYQPIR